MSDNEQQILVVSGNMEGLHGFDGLRVRFSIVTEGGKVYRSSADSVAGTKYITEGLSLPDKARIKVLADRDLYTASSRKVERNIANYYEIILDAAEDNIVLYLNLSSTTGHTIKLPLFTGHGILMDYENRDGFMEYSGVDKRCATLTRAGATKEQTEHHRIMKFHQQTNIG